MSRSLGRRRRGRDEFVKSREIRAENLARKFEKVVNESLERDGSNLRFRYRGKPGEPDYEVYDISTNGIVCYFEAEFPDSSRWPPGGEWVYSTIRWPSRKWEHYKAEGGFFKERPLFLISVREDLSDAYYIDCKTWFKKAEKETIANGTVYYGLSKDDPELGRGIESIPKYISKKIEENYSGTKP